MAGNDMQSTSQFNSPQTPFAYWDIEQLAADITVTKVLYSRSGEINVGQTTMVTIELRNSGQAPGSASLLVYEVGADGENRSLTPVPISVVVQLGERTTYDLDWIPETSGDRWVVVASATSSMEGDRIQVVDTVGDNPLGSVLDGVPISWIVTLVVLILVLTAVVSVALRTGGSGESALEGTDDWEDYDGWTEEEESVESPGPSTQVAEQHYDQQSNSQHQEWTPEQYQQYMQQQQQYYPQYDQQPPQQGL